jgi:mono/diheme cytochrome c family protein
MRISLIVLAGTLLGASLVAAPQTTRLADTSAAGAATNATFYKDVLPVLQKNCQSCHRPGEVAPMSLLTYEQARPWARAIKSAIATKQMPPWFADPAYGHFANERRLSAREIDAINSWVDAGAPAGNPSDAPPALVFENGWNIKPDIVVEMPKPFAIPASGTVNYKYVVVKGVFTQDLWVSAAEMRPGNSKVLHHGKVWVRLRDRSGWPTPPTVRRTSVNRTARSWATTRSRKATTSSANSTRASARSASTPTAPPSSSPKDRTWCSSCTTRRRASRRRMRHASGWCWRSSAENSLLLPRGPTAMNLAIPVSDGNAEVVSEITFGEDARLVNAQPHMHLRGKDFELRVVTPDKKMTTVLKGTWNFEWQMGYQYAEPIALPKGSKLQFITHFDNSPANKFNPTRRRRLSGDLRTGMR